MNIIFFKPGLIWLSLFFIFQKKFIDIFKLWFELEIERENNIKSGDGLKIFKCPQFKHL